MYLVTTAPQVTLHQYHNYQENDIIDNGLKSSIFIVLDVLLLSVNYHEFTCGQKVVRCVSMA
jgi:hypothetical protein